MALRRRTLLAAACFAVPALARAHGDAHQSGASATREQKPWGIAGEPKAVTRTIAVTMGDDMRFSPSRMQIRQGETIRFVLRNDGRLMHEFVIGTRAELDQHAALMVKFPTMQHDEPYMAHVAPGQAGEIIWHFNRAGRFEFACLIAGHYSAGMVGTITVTAANGVQ